jgi:putative tryptophan/tyrosine transport system substrate-binding protein
MTESQSPLTMLFSRHTKRREFIMLLGGAAAWPVSASAQQPAMPVVGFLYSQSRDAIADRLRAFRQGLKETGFVDGENVGIVFRWADNQIDRLPELAAELARGQVALIAAGNDASALAAKAATTTIPIVFGSADDPVRRGLVASLSRPGGNLTGFSFFNVELAAKRLELLREMTPAAIRVAVLVNPAGPNAERTLRDLEGAARVIGLQIQAFNASTSREIDAAFATLVRDRADALFVSNDGFFTARRVQLANAAAHYSIPATYGSREITEVGGLMSYASNIPEMYRQMGIYAGRILRGAKPADLPVVQASKIELVINAQAARTLGLTVPPTLLARADEVIE